MWHWESLITIIYIDCKNVLPLILKEITRFKELGGRMIENNDMHNKKYLETVTV